MNEAGKQATRPGRSETRQRTAHLPTVRATPAELEAIQAVFTRSGFRSFGAFARAALAGSRNRSAGVDRAELGRVLGALGSIGGNVNQLARAYNAQGEVPEESALAAIRAELGTMRAALMQALGHGG